MAYRPEHNLETAAAQMRAQTVEVNLMTPT